MIQRKKKKPIRYAMMDTETGGFDPVDNALLEIAIIGLDEDLEIVDTLAFLVKPAKGKIIGQGALAVNKIDVEEAKRDGVDVEDIESRIEEWFHKNLIFQQIMPIGHNYVRFDQKFMRVNISGYPRFFTTDCIDTLPASKDYARKERKAIKANLGAMREEFGIQIVNTHRALDDCYVNVEVLKFLVKLGYCKLPVMA